MRLRTEALEWRRIEDEIVAVDKRTSAYVAFNATAAALWPLLEKGCSAEEMARSLAGEYDLDHARALDDVLELVRELRAHDLLEE